MDEKDASKHHLKSSLTHTRTHARSHTHAHAHTGAHTHVLVLSLTAVEITWIWQSILFSFPSKEINGYSEKNQQWTAMFDALTHPGVNRIQQGVTQTRVGGK